MPPTLYGQNYAVTPQSVKCVLYEKGLSFKDVQVDLINKEQKSPAYLLRHPFGRVPAFEDPDEPFSASSPLAMFESRAVSRYIAVKYKETGTRGLVPAIDGTNGGEEGKEKDRQEALVRYARFEQACSMETSYWEPVMDVLAHEIFYGGFLWDKPPNRTEVEKAEKKLLELIDAYNKILQNQLYLAGDEFTLADIFHLPYGDLVEKQCGYAWAFRDYERWPNFAAWWKRISERPSWKRCVSESKIIYDPDKETVEKVERFRKMGLGEAKN